jgi:hypothetical protein
MPIGATAATMLSALVGGALMGTGYTSGAGVGYTATNLALAQQKAYASAKEYMYEQIYRVYIDYAIGQMRQNVGLKYTGLQVF